MKKLFVLLSLFIGNYAHAFSVIMDCIGCEKERINVPMGNTFSLCSLFHLYPY